MRRILLTALATAAVLSNQPITAASSWEECVSNHGDAYGCSQMTAIVRDDVERADYWDLCVGELGSIDNCNQILEEGFWTESIPGSAVTLKSDTNIRSGPTLDDAVMVVTHSYPTIFVATEVAYVPDDFYRWVVVEFSVGLDQYFGYVREDRVIESYIPQ